MEEKYKEFLNYNFENHPDWKSFLDNIEPKPKGNQLLLVKKKFFKRKVDNEFDTQYSPPSQTASNYNINDSNKFPQNTGESEGNNRSNYNQNNQNNNNNSRNAEGNQNTYTNNTYNNNSANNSSSSTSNSNSSSSPSTSIEKTFYYMYFVEVFFYFYFFYAVIFTNSPYSPATYGFVLRIVKLTWPIQMNKNYLSKLLNNETFFFLVYSLMMSFFTNGKLFIYLFPTGISCIIFIFGFYRRNQHLFPSAIESIMAKARSYQDTLIKTRQSSELLILPITALGIFLGFNSLILPIVYFQFLKMKLSIDQNLANNLNGLRNKLISNQASSSNGILKTIYGLGIKITDMLVNQQH